MTNEIGDWIRRNREKVQWSQDKLAEEVGVSPKTIGRWERGDNIPGGYQQRKLVKVFLEALQEELEPIPSVTVEEPGDQISAKRADSGQILAVNENKDLEQLEPISSSISGVAADQAYPEPTMNHPISMQNEPTGRTPQASPMLFHFDYRARRSPRRMLVLGVFITIVILVGAIIATRSFTIPKTREWPVVDAGKDQLPLQSSLIRVIQRMLISHNRPDTHNPYYLGETGVDGFAGPATKKAVEDFQMHNHLQPTGIVDTPTWEKLIYTSKANDQGDRVKALQEMLNTNSFLPKLAVDGIYGIQTVQVVERFQTEVGLPKTGKADMDTWCKLVGGQLK